MVYTKDLKSFAGNGLRVQVPPEVQLNKKSLEIRDFFIKWHPFIYCIQKVLSNFTQVVARNSFFAWIFISQKNLKGPLLQERKIGNFFI